MAQTQDLQRLVVSLEARIDKFNKDMAKVAQTSDRQLGRVEKRFKQAESVISRFGRGLTAAAVVGWIKGAISGLAELADQAKRTGVSVEKLQAAIFAIKQEGGNADQLVAALSKLNLNLGVAVTKGNDLGKILEANNVELSSLAGDPMKALLVISDLLKNTANEQDRAVIAQAAYGKAWQETLPFMMQGSAEIEKQMGRARELGAIIDTELIAKAKEFDDALAAVATTGLAQLTLGLKTTLDEFNHILEVVQAIMRELHISGPAAGQDPMGWLANKLGAGAIHDALFGPALPKAPLQHHPGVRAPATVNPLKGGGAGAIDAGRSAIEQTDDAIDKLIESMDEARSATKGFLSDLVGGLREGLTLTEALGKAFENLGNKLLDKALDQIVDQLLGAQGTAGTGLLGQLLGFNLKDQSRIAPSAPALPGPTAAVVPVMQKVLDTIARKAQPPGVKLPPPIDLTDAGGTVKSVEEMLDLSPKIPVIPVVESVLKNVARHPAYDSIAPSAANPLGDVFDLLKLLGGFFSPRAGGGPVTAGHPYLVGEKRPEVFVPNVNGIVMPRVPNIVTSNSGRGAQHVEVTVRAQPSKYLWLETDHRIAGGEARSVDRARRGYPQTAARFQKLGTT